MARVLDPEPVASLDSYIESGGGRGLDAARRLGPAGVVDDVEASGLRGRGGAGFPTGRKWRTVAEHAAAAALPATVVVNAAEGEPGTFKDRAILRANPYRVIEGALAAAAAVGADRVVLAMKATFERELARVRAALAEVAAAGWAGGLDLTVVEGPSEYLYGEETALLEVIAGRHPFPRIAPPFRHGLDETDPATKSAARVEMAGPGTTVAPPTLVNNTETFANVPGILAEGPDWFRSLGTEGSPGTVVCTVSGATRRHGVAEVPLGSPLGELIERVGLGPRYGRRLVAALSGVANPLVPADRFDTPVSHEALEGIGAGLGAAGFIVFDDATDLAAVAAGVSRFLAVESCGQCTPCKQDGLVLADLLERVCRSEADQVDLAAIEDRVATVADEARCYLAHQHQRVIASVLALFPGEVRAHLAGRAPAVEPELIAPIVDLAGDRFLLDEDHRRKQADWTYDPTYSGKAPADLLDIRSTAPT